MNIFQFYTTVLLLCVGCVYSQKDSLSNKRKVSIEPGIGISPMPIVDISLTNVVQWGLTKGLDVISYTSWKENNLFLRNFNYIKGTNNHSLSQKFGVGTSLNTKRSIHTVSILAGLKYTTYTETMNNPKFEKVKVKINSWSPDAGILYNLKLGKKKYFFSYRMYVPLAPYPLISRDISSIDGNLANVSLEAGLGIRLN
jgi:hypothetical protein